MGTKPEYYEDDTPVPVLEKGEYITAQGSKNEFYIVLGPGLDVGPYAQSLLIGNIDFEHILAKGKWLFEHEVNLGSNGLGKVNGVDLTSEGSPDSFLAGDGKYKQISTTLTTEWGSISGILGNQSDLVGALDNKEPQLGNPPLDGYVLASNTAGVRSWVAVPIKEAPKWGEIEGSLTSQVDLITMLNEKAEITGTTFTGAVKGITPTEDDHFTRKDYVDTTLDVANIAMETYVNQLLVDASNNYTTDILDVRLGLNDSIAVKDYVDNKVDQAVLDMSEYADNEVATVVGVHSAITIDEVSTVVATKNLTMVRLGVGIYEFSFYYIPDNYIINPTIIDSQGLGIIIKSIDKKSKKFTIKCAIATDPNMLVDTALDISIFAI